MRRPSIKNIYIKWILLFMALIAIAQAITLFLVIAFIVPDASANLGPKLYRKAEFAQEMYSRGFEISNDTFEEIGDKDIYCYVMDDPSTVPDSFSDLVSLRMLRQALDGEIVMAYFSSRGMDVPFCLVAVGEKVAFLSYSLSHNDLVLISNWIRNSIILGAIIGSIFVVFGLIVVIRPIKKVTQATKEVAKGDFDVRLETKSSDEIGQLIKNFNMMIGELKKNEYLKKDFVSSVSHEFKTPITSIEGYARLLKAKGLTAEQFGEYTDIIINETGRLSNLSSNLLKLSLLDSEEFEPARAWFYLDEQIRGVVLLLQTQWEGKQIEFDIEMEEVMYYSNEELMSQVWINLIQNAVKFSPARSTIRIRLNSSGEKLYVAIADQGAGIPATHSDKIFNRFYKVDRSHSKEGAGLGLAIVKRILEILGGEIMFESKAGKGTVFRVALPANAMRHPPRMSVD
jgi:signal transduction histidine kinase|nr:HAMP domain-containing histidine kinase [Clostridiales Family XIII bacterium]